MGQVGLHALTGLVVGQQLLSDSVRGGEARRALLFGFVIGNIIPDLDFIAVVGVYPVNHTLAWHLHRGFSHSLLASFAIGIGFYIAAVLMRDNYVRWLGYGLALGVASHFVEDIFIWFSPVDIFWPASVFGVIPPVNIWEWFTTPPLVGQLLGAAEFAAFGIYYDYLASLAVSLGTNREMVKPTRRMATVCYLIWAVLTALCFDIPEPTFTLYLYIPMGVVFMPAVLYITWRMQDTIELLSHYRHPTM